MRLNDSDYARNSIANRKRPKPLCLWGEKFLQKKLRLKPICSIARFNRKGLLQNTTNYLIYSLLPNQRMVDGFLRPYIWKKYAGHP